MIHFQNTGLALAAVVRTEWFHTITFSRDDSNSHAVTRNNSWNESRYKTFVPLLKESSRQESEQSTLLLITSPGSVVDTWIPLQTTIDTRRTSVA